MISKINTCSIVGTTAVLVMVESDVHNGLPDFKIVGATSTDVRDARDRVRVGMENAGFILPPKRITVSLVPAPVKKSGTGFDVAIALSVLSSFGFIHNDNLSEYMVFGEVALDGSLRAVNGVLFSVLFGMEKGFKSFIVPVGNLKECALLRDIKVVGIDNLFDLAVYLNGDESVAVMPPDTEIASFDYPVFSDISGGKSSKIAIITAISGGHSLLVSGKGQEDRRKLLSPISGVLVPESSDILIKAAYKSIYSDFISADPEIMGVPVLFFSDIKALKQKRENMGSFRGCITVLEDTDGSSSEKADIYSFYSCKCKAENKKNCSCTPKMIKDNQSMIQKILDEKAEIFAEADDTEDVSDEELRALYNNAETFRQKRFEGLPYRYNGDIPDRNVENICILEDEAKEFFDAFLNDYHVIPGEKYKILRLSRTIGDMHGAENISLCHLQEAIKLRGIYG